MKFGWRDAIRAFRDAARLKDIYENRDETRPSERANQCLEIAEYWVQKLDSDRARAAYVIGGRLVPYVDPFWLGVENGDGELVWDTAVDMLALVAPMTKGVFDDRLLPYAKSPMVRDFAVIVLGRVLKGEDELEVMADVMTAIDQPKELCGPAGSFGNGETGNPATIIAAVQLVLTVVKVVKWWRDRRNK